MRHRKAGGAFALGLVLSVALALHAAPAANASTYADAMLADAPRGYWRLGDSAGPAVDASGLGSTGAYTGGVVLGVPGALPGELQR